MKTVLLNVDPENIEQSHIAKAAEKLRAGQLVVFPTETVYGVGADVFNDQAVEKLFEAKRRDPGKPLQVLIAHKEQLKDIAERWSDLLDLLVERFMPGPLTLVIPARKDFPLRARCGRSTIGVRMPANQVALRLILAFGGPIAASSANISGRPDPRAAADALLSLGGKIALVLDGGATSSSTPSTVLDISVSPPVILRQGKLAAREIYGFLSSI